MNTHAYNIKIQTQISILFVISLVIMFLIGGIFFFTPLGILLASILLLTLTAISVVMVQTAAKQLEEQQVKQKAMLSSIGDGVLSIDSHEKIIFINHAAKVMLGWTKEEVLGRLIYDIIPMEDEHGKHLANKKRPSILALTSKTPASTNSYFCVRKDGTKFPVAAHATPVILDGTTIGSIEVIRDITHEKEVDRAKSEFVSLASHQLRTPLSIINWYLDALQQPKKKKDVAQEKAYLKEVFMANHRMVGLVDSLLNVSRLELGKMIIRPESFRVQDVVSEKMKELEPTIKKKNLKIFYEASSLPPVYTDPRLLEMVVNNFITNAIKYTPESGKLEVNLKKVSKLPNTVVPAVPRAQNFIIVSVKDTGYGIPKAQQASIFTRFFRADNVKTKDTQGEGLGLYLVSLIAKSLGWNVWFDSVEGKGSNFHVAIPLVQNTKTPRSP